MKRTAFDESRDDRIATETAVDRRFMCIATGCPNRWSVDAGKGRMCSAHAWSEPHQWPSVTQEQLDAETDWARYAAAERPAKAPLSASEKVGILRRLRAFLQGGCR